MNIDELLLQSLQGLAEPVNPDRSIATRVLQRIVEQSVDPAQSRAGRSLLPARGWSRLRWPSIGWPLRAGLAASLVGVAVAGWLLFAGGAPTIADVEAAVLGQHWVHLAFDDKSEEWVCLDDGRTFTKTIDGYCYLRDPATRTEKRYSPAIGEISIMKQQAWVVGVRRNGRLIPPEVAELDFSDLDAHKPRPVDQQALQNAGVAFEFDEVVEEGRKLGRFRTSQRDALGEMQIQKEVWVDLKTRLPFRIRSRLTVRDQQQAGRAYRTAKYEFGPTGPADLYDIGAPRTATIFQFRPRHEQFPLLTPHAQQALRGASQAIGRFPPQFRVIELGDKTQLTYWSATDEQCKLFANSILGLNWFDNNGESPRLFCADHQLPRAPDFVNAPTDPDSPPGAPLQADQIAKWFPIAKATNTTLFDGARSYHMTRFGKQVELHVLPSANYRRPPPFVDGWEYADWNHSEFATPKNEEPAPDGQLLIHSRRRDLKNNWYIDPAHDFTVARHVEWRLVAEKWEQTSDTRALAWQQTPSGSWYVSAWEVREPHIRQPDEGADAPRFDISRRRVEITPLETKDLPPDIFNGEKLLKRARKAGAKIQVD
jgi:hypothetical protein